MLEEKRCICETLTWAIFLLFQASFDFVVIDDCLLACFATVLSDGVSRAGASHACGVAVDANAMSSVFIYRTFGHAIFPISYIGALEAVFTVWPGTRSFTLRVTLSAVSFVAHRIEIGLILARTQACAVELIVRTIQALITCFSPATRSSTFHGTNLAIISLTNEIFSWNQILKNT